MTSPFQPSNSQPGHGTIDLAILPPSTPVLRTLSYQYPLKLISPSPTTITPTHSPSSDSKPQTTDATPPPPPQTIHTVYILTYGGGLVAADHIHLTATLAPSTRLILLTQGSTKVFNTPSPTLLSTQTTQIHLHGDCGLVYLPDPVQPFAKSAFEQSQIYTLHSRRASLCVLDWVSEGRRARGERWGFWRFGSRNEVRASPSPLESEGRKGRLLLRDNVFLRGEEGVDEPNYSERMDGLGCFGTMILYGPLMEALGGWFVDEFKCMPRIGARRWGDEDEGDVDERGERRKKRHAQELRDGVLWTASLVRGFVVVKVGAREVEGVKTWLNSMLIEDGSLVRHFGERALLCLR